MIIWSGLGFLVIPITVICVIFSTIIAQQFTSRDYIRLHNWPIGVGLLIAAAICWFLGRKLRDWRSQTLVDPKTGEEVVLRRGRSLFFVPMEFWAIPIAFFGILACFLNSTPEELRQRDAERTAKKEMRRLLQPSNERRP